MRAAVFGLGWWGKRIIISLADSEKITITHGIDLAPAGREDFMREHGVTLSDTPPDSHSAAPANTDLGRLQRSLAAGDTTPLTLENDGSLRLFSCTDTSLTARYLALHTAADALIIAPLHNTLSNTR